MPCAISTQVYLHAHLALKEEAQADAESFNGEKGGCSVRGDRLLGFLDAL